MSVLTIADLNPHHPGARRELDDAHCMHARVMALTDPHPPDGPRTLWALLGQHRLVIRSAHAIPPGRWPAGYTTATAEQPWTPPPTGPAEAIVVVNPVRRSTRDTGRVHTTALPDTDVPDWLTARLTAAGIDCHHVQVAGARTVHGWRRGRRISHRIAVCRVLADVIDPALAADWATVGAGRAKAYGAGLTVWWPR